MAPWKVALAILLVVIFFSPGLFLPAGLGGGNKGFLGMFSAPPQLPHRELSLWSKFKTGN